jgi:hypothetical protein
LVTFAQTTYVLFGDRTGRSCDQNQGEKIGGQDVATAGTGLANEENVLQGVAAIVFRCIIVVLQESVERIVIKSINDCRQYHNGDVDGYRCVTKHHPEG